MMDTSTLRRIVLLVPMALTLVAGCASRGSLTQAEANEFLDRSQTQSKSDVRVSVAVPSAQETRTIFGYPLYQKNVQPVWIEVENGREHTIAFLPVGTDSEYFTPIEAANLDLAGSFSGSDAETNRSYHMRGMKPRIGPGETSSGFVFTNLDEGTKTFNVDFGGPLTESFTFFVPVPGLRLDHQEVDWENIYPADQFVDLDTAALIEELEAQPCCTADKAGTGTGDPLNLVVIGDPDDVYYAFIRAGWDETETIYRSSLMKTIGSFFSGGEYRYSPVSGLYVFGRPQDVAFQRARSNIHERNHLRLWMSSARYQGKPVWLGQISRDIGVRFTRKTITTHKIDPNVDETREFLLENLAYAQSLAKFAYVGGTIGAPIDAPRGNLTGDPYFTDGYRVVLFVSRSQVAIDDIEVLDWRIPPDLLGD